MRKNIFLKTDMHFLMLKKEFLMLLEAKHFQQKLKIQDFQT